MPSGSVHGNGEIVSKFCRWESPNWDPRPSPSHGMTDGVSGKNQGLREVDPRRAPDMPFQTLRASAAKLRVQQNSGTTCRLNDERCARGFRLRPKRDGHGLVCRGLCGAERDGCSAARQASVADGRGDTGGQAGYLERHGSVAERLHACGRYHLAGGHGVASAVDVQSKIGKVGLRHCAGCCQRSGRCRPMRCVVSAHRTLPTGQIDVLSVDHFE